MLGPAGALQVLSKFLRKLVSGRSQEAQSGEKRCVMGTGAIGKDPAWQVLLSALTQEAI